MKSAGRSSRDTVVVGLLAIAIVSLFLVQIRQAVIGADRVVGVGLDMDVENRLWIFGVVPESPAEIAGLRAGDQLIRVDGREVHCFTDYDLIAADFRSDTPTIFSVLRESAELDLPVRPGMPLVWPKYLITCVVLLCCIALSWSAMRHSPDDLLARLVSAFSMLLALEISIPLQAAGEVALNHFAWSFFYLATGLQMSVALHLASALPEPPGWMKGRGFWVPLFYLFGGGLGLATAATYLLEELASLETLPWTGTQMETLLLDIAVPAWAIAVAVLLAVPTLRYPVRRGRLQSGLVLAGIMPLAAYDLSWTVFLLLGREFPDWTGNLNPVVIFIFPVAVFVAVYRYELFDLELVVRRSLLYSMLSTALLLLSYGLVGVGGALFSRILGPASPGVWVPTAAALVIGLVFSPLRNWLQRRIDIRLHMAGESISQRLVELAGELSTSDRIPLMSQQLVDRVSEIFRLHAVSLLLVDSSPAALVSVASSRRELQKELAISIDLPPQETTLAILNSSSRPLPLAEIIEISPILAQRLLALECELILPLVGKQLVGVLVLGRNQEEGGLGLEQRLLLQQFAPQVASAFENIRLFESATFESLTGLLRREAIIEFLETEIERALRYDRPLTAALLDLDRFKEVNDQYGHAAGDAVLCRVADEISERLRRSDAVGRYGGDEFLLVFPETDLSSARGVAEGIRERIGASEVRIGAAVALFAKVSIGLASLGSSGSPAADSPIPIRSMDPARSSCELAKDLIEAADDALYRAKDRGRNVVAT